MRETLNTFDVFGMLEVCDGGVIVVQWKKELDYIHMGIADE
jgi:hypothetical protein